MDGIVQYHIRLQEFPRRRHQNGARLSPRVSFSGLITPRHFWWLGETILVVKQILAFHRWHDEENMQEYKMKLMKKQAKRLKRSKNVRKKDERGFFLTQSPEYPDALVLAEVDKWRPHFLRRRLRPIENIKGSKKGPSGSEHYPHTKSFNLGLSDLVVKCSGKGGETKGPQSEIPGLTYTFTQFFYTLRSLLNRILFS